MTIDEAADLLAADGDQVLRWVVEDRLRFVGTRRRAGLRRCDVVLLAVELHGRIVAELEIPPSVPPASRREDRPPGARLQQRPSSRSVRRMS